MATASSRVAQSVKEAAHHFLGLGKRPVGQAGLPIAHLQPHGLLRRGQRLTGAQQATGLQTLPKTLHAGIGLLATGQAPLGTLAVGFHDEQQVRHGVS